MTSLNRQQKIVLSRLTQDVGWEVVLITATLLMEKWNAESVKADDQFNTLWNTAQREAKIDAVKQFLQVLEQEGVYDYK